MGGLHIMFGITEDQVMWMDSRKLTEKKNKEMRVIVYASMNGRTMKRTRNYRFGHMYIFF